MPAITVKNIPEVLYENLKLAAQLNHRSINSEIIACLEKELLAVQISAGNRVEKARVLRQRFKTKIAEADEIQAFIDKDRL